jgi:hypothetical protein
MRRPATLAVALTLLAALGCGRGPAPPAAHPVAVRVGHRPPLPKDIIDAAIASGQVELSVSPSCRNVGTESSDHTIGRYLAGFLAELSKPRGGNSIETGVEPGKSPDGEAIWSCRMLIRHVDGDDRWGWGVRFDVRQSDGLVTPGSFTCIGGG